MRLMITTAVAGPSVMVDLLSFEATGVFTVVGDHAVYCKYETTCFTEIELCNWCLQG
jgi:hypothetical protein